MASLCWVLRFTFFGFELVKMSKVANFVSDFSNCLYINIETKFLCPVIAHVLSILKCQENGYKDLKKIFIP